MEPITEPHPSSSNSNYAFITHSQETLPRNLPPSIDNATLARRRRRRTSVHDQAILEEEYRKCDRPDKTKRKEITSRVQMGEKEVQIWFQNKRQSARRKAKPLLPHEVIPNNNSSSQYSCQQVMPSSSQYSSFDNSQSFSSSQREEVMMHQTTSFNSDVLRRASVSSGIDCPSPPLADAFSSDVSASQGSGAYLGLSDADDDEELEDSHHHQQRYEHSSSYSKRQKLSRNIEQSSPTSSPKHEIILSQQQQQQQQQQKNHVSLSNYELPEPEMTTSAHQRLQDVLSSTPSQPIKSTSSRRTNPTTPHQPPRLLKRSSSIRLSTSLEGKATVVLDEEPESPPPSQTLPTPKKPVPNPVCRSTGPARKIVDSKIWEFYCDNQAMIRSPAQPSMQPAEAKQALGLLRKKSNASSSTHNPIESPVTQRKIEDIHRKIIHSSPTKAKKSRKVISQKSSRPKHVSADHKKSHAPAKKLVDHQGFPLELSQESDKENRPPGAPVSPPPEPRRRLGVPGKGEVASTKKNPEKAHRKKKRQIIDERKILGDYRSIPSQTASSSVFYEIPSSSQYIEEREDEPVEDEVAGSSQQSFSYFESSQDSTISRLPSARVDEMECVENLLSLRGGTWR